MKIEWARKQTSVDGRTKRRSLIQHHNPSVSAEAIHTVDSRVVGRRTRSRHPKCLLITIVIIFLLMPLFFWLMPVALLPPPPSWMRARGRNESSKGGGDDSKVNFLLCVFIKMGKKLNYGLASRKAQSWGWRRGRLTRKIIIFLPTLALRARSAWDLVSLFFIST